ncbi:MAG: carboxypeptidase regulatory-like domain-containing protein [Candidatus Thermoplasmatota archaeon]|nr:carboxypeptidase regulatory-like domain-containing protein [Candidatus Thermoplasmatota archaeon]
MKTKKKIAMTLFFLLGLSTLLFGAFILYITYDLESLDGRTVLTGEVKDTDDMPIEGVEIRCDDRETLSDADGQWTLKGVPEGLVTVDLYHPGYVRLSIKWLAYPLSDLEEGVDNSSNDLTYSLERSGDDGIVLKREMEIIERSFYTDGDLTLSVNLSAMEPGDFTEIFYSNATKDLRTQPLGQGITRLVVSGNGSFRIGLENEGPFLYGFHPVPGEIDVTDALMEMIASGRDLQWSGLTGILNVSLQTTEEKHGSRVIIRDNLTGNILVRRELELPAGAVFSLPSGVYVIEVTSRFYRDVQLTGVVVPEGSRNDIQVDMEEADTESLLKELSVKGNFTIAVSYILISVVLFFGGYCLKKGGSWAVLLILAFVGFLSRGPIDLFIFNINSLLAIVLVVVLFSMRGDYNLNKQKKMQQREGTG